jgi:hypothetical protein
MNKLEFIRKNKSTELNRLSRSVISSSLAHVRKGKIKQPELKLLGKTSLYNF